MKSIFHIYLVIVVKTGLNFVTSFAHSRCCIFSTGTHVCRHALGLVVKL